MTKKPMLFAIAFSAFLATGAIMNISAANAAPICPPGEVCPSDGTMQKPHTGNGVQTHGVNQPMHKPHSGNMQMSGDNQNTQWRHRHHNYNAGNVGIGIYVNDGYGDGYSNGWHHRHHCKMVKAWHHHHRVWVKRCGWHHRY